MLSREVTTMADMQQINLKRRWHYVYTVRYEKSDNLKIESLLLASAYVTGDKHSHNTLR